MDDPMDHPAQVVMYQKVLSDLQSTQNALTGEEEDDDPVVRCYVLTTTVSQMTVVCVYCHRQFSLIEFVQMHRHPNPVAGQQQQQHQAPIAIANPDQDDAAVNNQNQNQMQLPGVGVVDETSSEEEEEAESEEEQEAEVVIVNEENGEHAADNLQLQLAGAVSDTESEEEPEDDGEEPAVVPFGWFLCRYCYMAFASKQLWIGHRTEHLDYHNHLCLVCADGHVYDNNKSLAAHFRFHHYH